IRTTEFGSTRSFGSDTTRHQVIRFHKICIKRFLIKCFAVLTYYVKLYGTKAADDKDQKRAQKNSTKDGPGEPLRIMLTLVGQKSGNYLNFSILFPVENLNYFVRFW